MKIFNATFNVSTGLAVDQRAWFSYWERPCPQRRGQRSTLAFSRYFDGFVTVVSEADLTAAALGAWGARVSAVQICPSREAVLDSNHDIVEQVFSEAYVGENHLQGERGA